MPFKLTNAPATFQAYINEALEGLLDVICIAYLDDILIFSQNPNKHTENVRLILDRLRKYKLYVKRSKCRFLVTEVEFLGFIVGVDGVKMDPSKVKAIEDWPMLKSYHAIQVFLGFTNFYRGFIPGYSRVTTPLTNLLKGMDKGRKTGLFTFPTPAERAFQELKDCFTRGSVLAYYDLGRQCRVESDTSGKAIGGILI